jgi:hypothetical protein
MDYSLLLGVRKMEKEDKSVESIDEMLNNNI